MPESPDRPALISLRHQFEAAEGTFLLIIRTELRWDWPTLRQMTSTMFHAIEELKGESRLDRWIAEGFWFCDTWVPAWTSHPDFPQQDSQDRAGALELIHDLAFALMTGQSPYQDDTLRVRAVG